MKSVSSRLSNKSKADWEPNNDFITYKMVDDLKREEESLDALDKKLIVTWEKINICVGVNIY